MPESTTALKSAGGGLSRARWRRRRRSGPGDFLPSPDAQCRRETPACSGWLRATVRRPCTSLCRKAKPYSARRKMPGSGSPSRASRGGTPPSTPFLGGGPSRRCRLEERPRQGRRGRPRGRPRSGGRGPAGARPLHGRGGLVLGRRGGAAAGAVALARPAVPGASPASQGEDRLDHPGRRPRSRVWRQLESSVDDN